MYKLSARAASSTGRRLRAASSTGRLRVASSTGRLGTATIKRIYLHRLNRDGESHSWRRNWWLSNLGAPLKKGLTAVIPVEFGFSLQSRNTHYYISQGRAIRRVVTLFESIEDLVAENDRRCDIEEDASTTFE
jgi:hypothetical protein